MLSEAEIQHKIAIAFTTGAALWQQEAAHAIAEEMWKRVVYDREVHVKEDIIEGTDAYLVSESGIVGRLYDWPVRGSQRARVTVTLLEDMLLEEEDGQI